MTLSRTGRTVALLTLITLIGCAGSNTYLTQIWRNPDYRGDGIQKVLIIGVSDQVTTKRLFEDHLSILFREKGIIAEPSFSIIPSGQTIDKDLVRSSIDGEGYDAVLVTRLVARETQSEYVPGEVHVVEHWDEPVSRSLYPFFTRTLEVEQDPGYSIETEIVRLETNVYDVATESLTWSAISETFDPTSMAEAVDSFGAAVLKGLAEMELIR